MGREIRHIVDPDDRSQADKAVREVVWSPKGNPAQRALLEYQVFEVFFGGARDGSNPAQWALLQCPVSAGRTARDPRNNLTRDNRAFLAPQDGGDLHVAPITTTGGLDAAGGQRAGNAAHAADPARLDFLDDGADVGGERIGGLATGSYGRLAGCGEARAAELGAAALGGR